jgi:uncharacterized protein YxeA
MEKNRLILIILVLAAIALIIWVIKKNHKDRKNLFKKLPGDPPDPEYVKPESTDDGKHDYKFQTYKGRSK